jgi:hypothetical protein
MADSAASRGVISQLLMDGWRLSKGGFKADDCGSAIVVIETEPGSGSDDTEPEVQ